MRVLFIYPNLDCPPGVNHGLLGLSGVLKAKGHSTKLIHVCENLWPVPSREEIADVVRGFDPGLIGFSVMSQQHQWACATSKYLRGLFPQIPQVVGGVHCTMVPDEVTQEQVFDYVCVGEGEYSLLELVERLEKGEDTTTVPNMRMVRDGKTINNKVGPFPDLRTIAPLDYDLFDVDHIIAKKRGWMGLLTSRGCPYKCTYCFNWEIVEQYIEDGGAKSPRDYLRTYDIDRILDEVRMLKQKHSHMTTLIFDDDLFTLKRDYVKAFSAAYRDSGIGLPFVVNAHVQTFDREIAKALREAGCMIVKFGVESGSEKIRRDVLYRYMDNARIVDAFQAAHEYGLHSSAFVMLGLPHEKVENIYETMQLCADAEMGRFRWAVFFPFPGTAAYRIAKEADLIDYQKMEQMGNYFDGSCLRITPDHDLAIEKMGKLFHWWVNSMTNWPTAPTYKKLVKEVEAMSRDTWQQRKEELVKLDRELSEEFLAKDLTHYSLRYAHVMGVHSDFVKQERVRLANDRKAEQISYTLD
jgi:radical SAM superfamily enzyme YgiQ (UPF0313 family)